MKLASIALAVSCLLAACGNTTPTAPPPAPAGSPVAHVEASAPVVNGVEAPPSSGDPAPSASAVPQPTASPDPDALRQAAATGFLAAGAAHVHSRTPAYHNEVGRRASELWGQYAAALKQLQVPADTGADLHDLIRAVTRIQAVTAERRSDMVLYRSDARYQIRYANVQDEVGAAAGRVRTDLGLPLLPFRWPNPLPPDFASP